MGNRTVCAREFPFSPLPGARRRPLNTAPEKLMPSASSASLRLVSRRPGVRLRPRLSRLCLEATASGPRPLVELLWHPGYARSCLRTTPVPTCPGMAPGWLRQLLGRLRWPSWSPCWPISRGMSSASGCSVTSKTEPMWTCCFEPRFCAISAGFLAPVGSSVSGQPARHDQDDSGDSVHAQAEDQRPHTPSEQQELLRGHLRVDNDLATQVIEVRFVQPSLPR